MSFTLLSKRYLASPADVASPLVCLKQPGIMEHHSLLQQLNVLNPFSVCLANTFGSGSTLFCKWESLPHRSRRLLQVSGNYFPNCCQLKQKCICHFLSNPSSGIKLNKQMLVTDPHGQKKGPAGSAVVFVIAGPWRQTLGDTHRALSLTSSEQCYFLGFR